MKVEGCFRYSVNFYAEDIEELPARCFKDCLALCRKNTDCKTATFYSTESKCYLKSGSSIQTSSNNYHSVEMSCIDQFEGNTDTEKERDRIKYVLLQNTCSTII